MANGNTKKGVIGILTGGGDVPGLNLEPDASSPKYILTEPWVGYRFEPGD